MYLVDAVAILENIILISNNYLPAMNNLNLPQILIDKVKNQNLHFIITGASGWIGKALLETLYHTLGKEFSQKVFAISATTKTIELRGGISVKTYNYNHDFPQNKKYIIFHLAFLTKDKLASHSEEEFLLQNQKIRSDITKIINDVKPQALFYSSSGAAHSQSDQYGIEKLDDEKYFAELAEKNGFEIIIPRIFNIAGPYINKVNLYALSDFIMQSKLSKTIKISAKIKVLRSYIHISDLLKICFSWILDDNKKEHKIIFDTANYDELEMADLADLVAKVMNNSTQIIRPEFDEKAAENRYVGDGGIQKKLCQKYGINILNHQEIIEDTAKYLSQTYHN